MFTVIYKPTLECNQACRYCYVGLRHAEFMSQKENGLHVFTLLLDNLIHINDKNISIIFHGGEPLLMSDKYFDECAYLISEYESEYDLSIKKCVQTNLLNVSVDKLTRLQNNGYEISTSLDGTELAHDYFRIDRSGNKTFKKVVENIKLAKRMGFIVNAICCVSQLNMRNFSEIYDLFEELQVNPKFNYLEAENDKLPSNAKINPEQYADFVLNVTDKWLRNADSKIDVMPSSDMLSAVVNGHSESCIHSRNCQRHFVCVGPNGDVWPCGKSIGVGRFRLGSVCDPENGVVSYERRRNTFGKEIGLPLECHECEFFVLCNGGCPFDTFAEHECFDKVSRWCRAHKLIWTGMKYYARLHNLGKLT